MAQYMPLQAVLQGQNEAEAKAITQDGKAILVSYHQNMDREMDFYRWYEDKEELTLDDVHIVFRSDFEDGVAVKLWYRYDLEVNAPIWTRTITETAICEACGRDFNPAWGYYEPGEYAYCSRCCHW